MYFAAMRPAEVIYLRLEQCHLSETGWGLLNLTGGVVTAGKDRTDDGEVHEVHSLKRRAATATRPVPIPPQFVRVLLAHIERFGVAPDGRLFQNLAGNYVEAAAYGITWSRAREYVLTRTELAASLAKRPYDLRHAGISFWLHSGSTLPNVRGGPVTASMSCSGTTPSSWTVCRSRPTVSSSSPWRNGTVSARAAHPPGERGLVRDWSGTAGLEWDAGGRNWEEG
ncbi:hypothetical protein Slala03_77740 [Streptomyces lavendulae subsp. lavendulae]|uniref:hypothetical protein n=1 Tax=Streptomyces lavendulae TaxID=1914 RepID=UPI0024A59EEC|nr:hypothetical protein [Streptomyces lavendulae]GLV88085.1 hypothetical protein Slala03_77740 [Streptomyces lavendulae subsp. lavendulae]